MADNAGDDRGLAAGDFSPWILDMQAAIRGERGSDVPCGECTACCTSSQFVHIGPDETDTLACIPDELLFPAPLLPDGHVLVGYDQDGRCPMLIDGRCSIYENRPRTCRTYDCRILAASGLELGDEDKVLITRQVQRWRFSFPTEADRVRHEAVRAAATFVDAQRTVLPSDAVPTNATQLAVLAVEVHDAFLGRDGKTGQPTIVDPDPDVVRVQLTRRARPRRAR